VNFTANAAPVAPTISTQPGNQTVTAGQTATFTVASTGTAPLSYQWQKNSVNIAGATAASYTTPVTTTADSGSTFAVVVSNTAGTVTSAAATLTVSATAVAPAITTQPGNQTVTAGQTATFTVAATGTAPLAYQWQKNSVNITGATSASYTTPATTTADSGSTFAVVVSNTAGSATSSAATLTVNSGTAPPSVPTGLTAGAASSSEIDLSWNASTGSVAGYKIFRGGSQIGTSTTTTFADMGLPASTSFTYTVAAYDAAGNTSAQSASASATTMASSGGGGIPSSLGWYQIPNTLMANVCPPGYNCANVIIPWSGGIGDTSRNRLIVWGGGHTDYPGNEVYSLNLGANPITLTRLNNPSPASGSCVEVLSDGTPPSRHTYDDLSYIAHADRMFSVTGSMNPTGCASLATWTLALSNLQWQNMNPSGTKPLDGGLAATDYDPNTKNVFIHTETYGQFGSYNYDTNTYRTLSTFQYVNYEVTAVVDPKRKFFFMFGAGGAYKIDISGGDPSYSLKTLAATGCTFTGVDAPGAAYDPVQDRIVGWSGGNTVYLYNPDTDSCTSATYPNGPGAQQLLGTYGRFRYFPSVNVFALVNDASQNAYILRLTAGGGGSGSGSGPNISGVGANAISTSGATITWTTDVQATSQVEYGTTTAYGTLTTLNSSLVTAHSVALTGLSTGTLYHYRVRSKNSSGVESISADSAFSTNNTTDTTPPTVSITSPAGAATVSGTVNVTATATDNVGVTSVQILLDGVNLGAAVTSSPYTVSWDTTTASNGVHSLSAQARDAAGNVGNAVPVAVTVSNSTSSALQDFQTRCAQTGVLVCQGFDDPSVFTPAVWPASGAYPADNGAFPAFDPTVSASGGGSMRFTIPSQIGSNMGYWRQLIGQNFGAGSTFYVQFRQRFSPEYLTNKWPATGGGTTWWKQEVFSNHTSTCADVELTTINQYGNGWPTMYSACGNDNFYVNLPNGDLLLEQGDTSTTGYNCHYQNPTPQTCFMYPANTWVTFYWKISIGHWGQPDSYIQAWVSVGGQPYKQWINLPNHTLYNSTPGNDYDMVTLLPYMTGRDPNISAGPTAYTWYDELIVSTQPIATPNN